MTTTAQRLPTPDAQALADLAAAGALDHGLDGTVLVEDTWVHTDPTCSDLGAPSPAIAAAALAAALREGDLQLCACAFPTPGAAGGALHTLAWAVSKADRSLADLAAGGRWDQQLGRVTQVRLQRDTIGTLLLEHALTAPLARWATATVDRYDARLQEAAAELVPQIRTGLPTYLTQAAAQRRSPATPVPAPSGPRLVACAPSPFDGGEQSTIQRAVAYAWPTTSRGRHFYAQVPGDVPWSTRGSLVDCGPQNDTDTPEILDVALQLQAGVTQGAVQDPAGALRAARLLVGGHGQASR